MSPTPVAMNVYIIPHTGRTKHTGFISYILIIIISGVKYMNFAMASDF